jgi:hypothetical protein
LLKDVRGCAPYPASCHLSIKVVPAQLRRELLSYTNSLIDWSDRPDLLFFQQMLVPPFDDGRVRALFALLRTAFVRLAGDDRAALYSPVSRQLTDRGFELHADLFLTTRLWLIFDDVPADGSGTSLFLSRDALLQGIQAIGTMPKGTVRYIKALMTRPLSRDSFDELYRTIHSSRNCWYDSLKEEMRGRVRSISLRRGEGYLIDDRRWLHGRTATSGPVTSGRFHRLTFWLRSETR